MRRLRSCLTIFCFGLFGLGGLIIGTILFPLIVLFLPSQNRRLILINVVHYSWIVFVKIMIFLRLISVKLSGKYNFKSIRGYVIVANHPTLLDIVLLISIIPNTICIVKSSLLKNFFIKHIIQRIYLVNGGKTEEFLNMGQDILSQGINIIIFPEGTRTDNKNDCKLHRGFAQLAVRSKAPILPVQISCTPLILGKKQKWYDIGDKTAQYHINFLPSVKNAVNSEKTYHQQAKTLSKSIYSKLFERIN